MSIQTSSPCCTSLALELCGVSVQIHFIEKHLIDLQEILKLADKATQ